MEHYMPISDANVNSITPHRTCLQQYQTVQCDHTCTKNTGKHNRIERSNTQKKVTFLSYIGTF